MLFGVVKDIVIRFIFFLQALLLCFWWFEEHIDLPIWIRVIGRLHPAVLHLPIGILVFAIFVLLLRSELKKRAFRNIMMMVLLFASLTASITALLGFFLSHQSDYGADWLQQHRLSGILLSILCYLLLIGFERTQRTDTFFYATGGLAIVTVLFAGHTGGYLTHGQNFIFAPISDPRLHTVSNGSVYQVAILPLLERKCISCHNESKSKGKLIMTDLDKFRHGGKKGKEWVEGAPDKSRMVRYLHLPMKDEDHMPPEGKPQLTSSEIRLIELWIQRGPDFSTKVDDLNDGDSLKILSKMIGGQVSVAPVILYNDIRGASATTVAELNTPFCSVFPLYRDSPALQADFFIQQSYRPEQLSRLKAVADQLVVLNMNQMPVSDQDLETIGNFHRLEKLNLSFSKITGSGFKGWNGFGHLRSVALTGTAVTAENIKPLLAMPALEEVFMANTSINEAQRKQLAKLYPKVRLVVNDFVDNQTLKLSAPAILAEGLVSKGQLVPIRSAMPGVTIRYTLDGSAPDSIGSVIYDKPLSVSRPTFVRAIACKPGWYCSAVTEATIFPEGLHPVSATLLSSPDKQYPGEGGATLINGRKGFLDVYREPSWLGYREQPMEALFDFGEKSKPVSSMVVSYAHNLGSYIFPPAEIEVYAGASVDKLDRLVITKPRQPQKSEPTRMGILSVPLKSASHRYYKLVLKPVAKLPLWHSGKGSKGWVMVDEVFFY
ncbi:MAG TPA: FN3 associated domain-containing protein [Cyclobacteriaceae bacterium]|nr:FN3 associated domain-containing protein [Cyclobacteriaceae bacterium]